MMLRSNLRSRRRPGQPAWRGSQPNHRIPRAAALAGTALGVWMLAWAGAAEAQEPSRTGGAPSAIAASAASPLSLPPMSLAASELASRSGGVTRRPWRRDRDRDRYRDPDRDRWGREPDGWVTLRGGFFDTEHVNDNDWLLGAKVTGRVGRFVRLGVSADLQRRDEADRELISEYTDPTGNVVRTQVTRFESSSNLVPILAVMEVHPTTGPLRPYLGAGAGYEALVVNVRDFQSGIEYDDDYGGFGWQAFAGLELPLARNLNLGGEAFANFGTVKRTVQDFETGYEIKEEIDVDGVGFRGGISFGF